MQTDNHVSDELYRLRAENARLRALLAQHVIPANEPKTKAYFQIQRPMRSMALPISKEFFMMTLPLPNEVLLSQPYVCAGKEPLV